MAALQQRFPLDSVYSQDWKPAYGRVRVIGYDNPNNLVRVQWVNHPQIQVSMHPDFLRPIQAQVQAPVQEFATYAEALAVGSGDSININADYNDPINMNSFQNGENVYKLNDHHIFKGNRLREYWQGTHFINPLTGLPPRKNKIKRGPARIRAGGSRRRKHKKTSRRNRTLRRQNKA